MICSIINEGTAPRHALGGSLPTSKPVAPSKHCQHTLEWPRPGEVQGRRPCAVRDRPAEATLAISHDPRLVALPVAVLVHRPLVVLFLALGETNGQLGAAVLP